MATFKPAYRFTHSAKAIARYSRISEILVSADDQQIEYRYSNGLVMVYPASPGGARREADEWAAHWAPHAETVEKIAA